VQSISEADELRRSLAKISSVINGMIGCRRRRESVEKTYQVCEALHIALRLVRNLPSKLRRGLISSILPIAEFAPEKIVDSVGGFVEAVGARSVRSLAGDAIEARRVIPQAVFESRLAGSCRFQGERFRDFVPGLDSGGGVVLPHKS